MDLLDLAAFRSVRLAREPFPFLIVPGFIKPAVRDAVHADFPAIDQPGSFPVAGLTYGPAFNELVQVLTGPAFQRAVEDRFQIDLRGRATMLTVRGRCGPRDGNIHTDSVNKLVTVLIYLNPTWEDVGGRLRLLRSAWDIDDVLVEIPPVEGALVAFRRTDHSFHGHKRFIGPRRVVQLNWATGGGVAHFEQLRHRASAWVKRAFAPRRRAA
jgi:hypothetical protein